MSPHDTLFKELPVYRQALDWKPLQVLWSDYNAWLNALGPGTDHDLELVHFLVYEIGLTLDKRRDATVSFEEFNRLYAVTPGWEDRQNLVIQLASELGASKTRLFWDRRAFQRYFGVEAVVDRYWNLLAQWDKHLALVLDRLGCAIEVVILRKPESGLRTWQFLEIEAKLEPVLSHDGDARVQEATFSCLARCIRSLSVDIRETALEDATLRYVYRCALSSQLSVWTQSEALELLAQMSMSSFVAAVDNQLSRQTRDDQIFVRSRALDLCAASLDNVDDRDRLFALAEQDPAPYVRQAICRNLASLSDEKATQLLPQLMADQETAVVAEAVCAVPALAHRIDRSLLFGLLVKVCTDRAEVLLTRLVLEKLADIDLKLRQLELDAATWSSDCLRLCRELHVAAEQTRVRRWASRTGEQLWLQSEPHCFQLYFALKNALSGLKPGKHRRLPVSLIEQVSVEDLGRIFALLAIHDHGFDIEYTRKHIHVIRGHRFAMSFWRTLFEIRHSATDKRQGFRHTIGRHFFGTWIAPSAILCEQAKTKVPGEPLYLDDEDGWRPFLPLIDNFFGALGRGIPVDPVQLVTTEGVTEILPPASVIKRWQAWWWLCRHVDELAEYRNWDPSDAGRDPQDFIRSVQDLGFRVRFRPHDWQQESIDDRVTRFFPGFMAMPSTLLLPELFERANNYFYSLYQNTLGHLAMFLGGMGALFFGQHLVSHQRIYRARKSIALVIGGWGTRGKSGTERLKAGLFNALGYPLVSKTTGCEAMFIFSRPFGKSREMFLFRPYDKATIWEQANLLDISRGLGTDVFLWECMALTPSYVEILQRQWMRDDYATITNAYPDHEDIQGPAGVNIPEVIANFIPRHSNVVTTEEFMVPILRSEASRVGSVMHEVGWREALLLTSDVLDRFPYDEHPYNIALVLELADMLGIHKDFAVKEMADRVIADLGVLKTFPRVTIRGRTVEFVNGMSANERFGALGNWRRMGFESQDQLTEPGTWLVTVINNRADRVARSKVFASVLVSDLSADMHLLIGTNLSGLVSYIEEAWESAFQDFSLGDGLEPGSARIQAVTGWLDHMRVPYDESQLQAKIAIVSAENPPSQVQQEWQERFTSQCAAAGALLTMAGDSSVSQRELESQLVEQMHRWFTEKLVVLEDSGSSGEQVVDRLVETIPPNMFSRVIGMQNIKGTGLDFMYRWLAWETVHQACENLLSPDSRVADEGRQALLGFQEFGLLSRDKVIEVLDEAQSRPAFQAEAIQAQLATIRASLDRSLAAIEATLDADDTSREGQGGVYEKVLSVAEQVLDSFDAIKRRRKADLIYRELIAERISPEQAAVELQGLNKRQKGGWLIKSRKPA